MFLHIKKTLVVSCLAFILAGCNFSDDDPEINVAPVAISVDLTTQADVIITETAAATDENGDSLSYAVVTEPVNGTLTLQTNGQYVYTPNSTFIGADSFVFSVSDGTNPAVNGTVNLTIEAQIVGFEAYSRQAFSQQPSAEPLPINWRDFTKDVADPSAYDDLIENP